MKVIIQKIIKKYDYWIEKSYHVKAEHQSIFRIIYSLYILLILGIPNWSWLGSLSISLFDPPKYSISGMFGGFPDSSFFILLGIILCIFYVFLLFGYKTKFTSILITFVYIVGNSFYFSRGKINHTDLLIVITPLIMAFSNWGDYYSIDSKNLRKSNSKTKYWPISLLVLTIGFAYFTAGLPKLLGGWLSIYTHAVKGILFNYYYTNGYQDYLAPYLVQINNDLFWETFDYIAVIFEITILIAVFLPTIFRFYLILAVIFHLLNYLILNIPFVENLAVYALFINFSLFSLKISNNKLRSISLFLNSKYTLLTVIILQLLTYFLLDKSIFISVLRMLDIKDFNIVLLVSGFLIALLHIGNHLYKLVNK